MLKYKSQKLSYKKFIRSKEPHTFQEFEKPDVAICWIDLLGVSEFNHEQITLAVQAALESGVEGSCTGPIFEDGILVGNPNSATQFCLVGDALLVVEKDQPETPAAAKLSFFYRVNLLSRLLNERGLLHRGVITTGPIKCFRFEGSSLITGFGVLKAAGLERKLKVAGLFYDETVISFMGSRAPQLNNQSAYVPFASVPDFDATTLAPGLVGSCFSQYEGWEYWKDVVSKSNQKNDKVINAQSLLRHIGRVHQLK